VRRRAGVVVDVAELGSFRVDGAVLSLEALRQWAHAVGQTVPVPVVITLDGPLGAGKTTVAQGIATGAGVTDAASVSSPTFSLIHEYEAARGPIAHLDLYRLSTRDVERLGVDEVIERSALVMIEWSERAAALLSGRVRLAIALDYPPADHLSHRVVHCRAIDT
jgi:tRNA threonylcarbamoyladenosine biosynthesis protein TsaE